MGELRRRGRVWWIRYYRNGRRHEESSRSTKKQAAIDLPKIREGDVAKGVPISAKVGQLRFREAAGDLMNDYTTNGRRSVRELDGRIRLHLDPFFGRGPPVVPEKVFDNSFEIVRRGRDLGQAEGLARTVQLMDGFVECMEACLCAGAVAGSLP